MEQALSYPEILYNNTYGIEAINQTLYKDTVENYTRPGIGCRDQTVNCQTLADELDPHAYGNSELVNEVCWNASSCGLDLTNLIYSTGHNYYDFTDIVTQNFLPSSYLYGYLAQHWVQGALGVPVNFTSSGAYNVLNAVLKTFAITGDWARKDIRGGQLADIAYLLDKGVKVALMYGDRDYACNCKRSLLYGFPVILYKYSTHLSRDWGRTGFSSCRIQQNHGLPVRWLRRYPSQ